MCLFPKLVPNPRYKPNKRNKGHPPRPRDERLRWITAACGRCEQCRRQKANEWKFRLNIELQKGAPAHFMTMTFNEEALSTFHDSDANEVAAKAVKLFRKRWYKKFGKSLRYWLITELGHENTKRLHLHGILWTEQNCETIEKIWSYGWVDTGEYVNEESIGYIVKYVTKVDEDHPGYVSKIFCSPGIGKDYMKRSEIKRIHDDKQEYVKTPKGYKVGMPTYFKNKIFTERERENLWLEKLNKQIRYVNGNKIDVSTKKGMKEFLNALDHAQKESIKLGNPKNPWERIKYEKSLKNLEEKFGN